DGQRAMHRQVLAVRLPRLDLRRMRVGHELEVHRQEEDAERDADQDQAHSKVRLQDRHPSFLSFEFRPEPPSSLSSSSSSCLPGPPKPNRPFLPLHASRTDIGSTGCQAGLDSIMPASRYRLRTFARTTPTEKPTVTVP